MADHLSQPRPFPPPPFLSANLFRSCFLSLSDKSSALLPHSFFPFSFLYFTRKAIGFLYHLILFHSQHFKLTSLFLPSVRLTNKAIRFFSCQSLFVLSARFFFFFLVGRTMWLFFYFLWAIQLCSFVPSSRASVSNSQRLLCPCVARYAILKRGLFKVLYIQGLTNQGRLFLR